MSCSIDRRGSILMEFVLVLPIYILLLGGLFLLGDMGLMALRISTGDRDVSMDAGDRLGHSMGAFLLQQMKEEAGKVLPDSRTYRANEKFNGAWSWQAGGRTSFAYKLQSWGGGLISYPFLHYRGDTSGGGILETLVGGGTVMFHSKDFSLGDKVRSYNYYTLKRTDLARDPRAYRNWDTGDDTSRNHLVESTSGFEQYWYSFVYLEDYADSDAEKLDSTGQGGDTLPNQPSGRREYKRFDAFVTWSQ